jgi:hypothetical protein
MKFIARLLAIATIATALTPCQALFAEKKSSRNIGAGITKLAISAGIFSLITSEILMDKYVYAYPPASSERILPALASVAALGLFLGLVHSGLDDIFGEKENTTSGAANVYYGYPTHNYTIYTPVTYTHLPEVYIDYPEVIIL